MSARVLIIDDDKEFLSELHEMLSMSGYETISVNKPADAVAAAIRKSPDVILIDLKMPGKSGFEVVDEFRQKPELRDTPILVMTGIYKDACPMLVDIAGIKRCLTKPFNPLDVIAEIEKAVNAA